MNVIFLEHTLQVSPEFYQFLYFENQTCTCNSGNFGTKWILHVNVQESTETIETTFGDSNVIKFPAFDSDLLCADNCLYNFNSYQEDISTSNIDFMSRDVIVSMWHYKYEKQNSAV